MDKREYSPHLRFYKPAVVIDYIQQYRLKKISEDQQSKLLFLDVGGRRGEFKKWSKGFDYYILECDDSFEHKSDVIFCDICRCTPDIIKDERFDIVFSNNVFEHLKEPWLAAENCVRITKVDGLIIHIAPFSWRYHPVPVDMFRYSHYGLAYLFERTGRVKTLLSGYDITMRRKNAIGGKLKGDLDKVPVDKFGGWIEHWRSIFIGKKV